MTTTSGGASLRRRWQIAGCIGLSLCGLAILLLHTRIPLPWGHRLWRTLGLILLLAGPLLGSARVRDAVARVQNAVLLGIVYVLGVGGMALGARLVRADLLDERTPRASMWKTREPRTPGELDASLDRPY